jgi:hypothetical protein
VSPSIVETAGGGYAFWGSEGPEAEPLILTIFSSGPFSGRLTIGFDGQPDLARLEGGPENILRRTISDFGAGSMVLTPAGGWVEDARLEAALDDAFLGFFRLSPPASSDDVSIGGYIDPQGNSVQLATAEHPDPHAILVAPEPGRWTFFLDRDEGLHGQPTLLFGLQLPRTLL